MRSPLRVLVAFAACTVSASLVCAQTVAPSDATAPTQSVRLRTGEVVTGRVESVHVGVDVSVIDANGAQRVIRWADVDTLVPASNPDGVHVGIAVGPAAPLPTTAGQSVEAPAAAADGDAMLHPGPARVALHVVSPNETLTLGAPADGMFVSVRGHSEPVFRALCQTPCTLFVPAGERSTVYTRGAASETFVERWSGEVRAPGEQLELWHPRELATAPTSSDPNVARVQEQLREDLDAAARHDAATLVANQQIERMQSRHARQSKAITAIGWAMYAVGLGTTILGANLMDVGCGRHGCGTAHDAIIGMTVAGALSTAVGITTAIRGMTTRYAGVWQGGSAPNIPPAPTIPEWVAVVTE